MSSTSDTQHCTVGQAGSRSVTRTRERVRAAVHHLAANADPAGRSDAQGQGQGRREGEGQGQDHSTASLQPTRDDRHSGRTRNCKKKWRAKAACLKLARDPKAGGRPAAATAVSDAGQGAGGSTPHRRRRTSTCCQRIPVRIPCCLVTKVGGHTPC